jgi:hypothetical protein
MIPKGVGGLRATWLVVLALFFVAILIIFGPLDLSIIMDLFLVVPIISMFLLSDAIRTKNRHLLLILAVYIGVSAVLIAYSSVTRTKMRWLLLSKHYKAEVLKESDASDGHFKHAEWDGWGMFAQNTVVYVVYPTNSLSNAAITHGPGKARGWPCEVSSVRRLENQWYAAQFYTNEEWSDCAEPH